MSLDAEVIVVGASVAGAATALGLRQRGRDVLLVDRDRFPREAPCGEGLMPHGVQALRGLGVEFSGQPFRGIRYQVGQTWARGDFPDGAVGLGVRRHDLDSGLVDACVRRGVGLALETPVRAVTQEQNRVTVQTDRGPLTAKVVVGADGRHSRVRRALGLQAQPKGSKRYGARRHVRLAPGRASGDAVQVFIGHTGVEVYLTPVAPDTVNVALLVEKVWMEHFRGDLERGMQRAIESCPEVASFLEGSQSLTPTRVCGPLRQAVRRNWDHRALLVGDAGGFVDAITGEGMSLALGQAAVASEVLDSTLDGSLLPHAFAPYGARTAALGRDLIRMTEIVLWGLRRRWLAERTVRHLKRHPSLFSQVLAVNTGMAPLSSIGLGGLRRLAVGW